MINEFSKIKTVGNEYLLELSQLIKRTVKDTKRPLAVLPAQYNRNQRNQSFQIPW